LAIAALEIKHNVELEILGLTKVPFSKKAILLKVYQVKYKTTKNTVFIIFGCANYVSTAGGYATVTKGLKIVRNLQVVTKLLFCVGFQVM